MDRYELRVWLPDRPGALGLVASRIGSVGGDVVGIDILERDQGQAIDELVVELADPGLVPLLLSEVRQVDGITVESIRTLAGPFVDPGVGALDAAFRLVAAHDQPALFGALGEACHEGATADWSAVAPAHGDELLFGRGTPPAASWIVAFVDGARRATGDPAEHGPVDVAWAEMPAAAAVLAIGRQGRPFRSHERRRLAGLAAIAERRWSELAAGDSAGRRHSFGAPAPGTVDRGDPAGVPTVGG